MSTDKLVELIKIYKDNPVLFTKQVIGLDLSEQQQNLINKAVKPNARVACKSCTGSGKTTTLACLIYHQLITEPDVKLIATAPSAGQLSRGLRAELGKLHGMMKEPFKSFYQLMSDMLYVEGKKSTHFCSLVTGSAENKENLAGVHAQKVLILVDEASAVSQEAYDTLVGNLTTDGSSIIQISNPVRPTGPFFNLFNNGELGKLWELITLDAFSSPLVSKDWIELVKAEYGEDSDFYRMRVLGEFPRSASSQFISTESVQQAINKVTSPSEYKHFPIMLGVDVARFGDDSTVFVLRQGPKIHEILEFKGLDTMEVSAKLAEYQMHKRPDRIFVDGGGLGAGVVDRCKSLNIPVVDVVASSKSVDPKQYSNFRAQVWGTMRDWLLNGGDIPNDSSLADQLTSMQYGYNNKMQIQLLSKKDIKKMGLCSPDKADALSLTFADELFKVSMSRRQPRQIVKSNTLWA